MVYVKWFLPSKQTACVVYHYNPTSNRNYVPMFQFTRPQGARLCRYFTSSRLSCFNSRAHRGRDSA